MEEVVIWFLTFILVYLVYYLFVIKKNKKSGKFKTSSEVIYLEKKYNVKMDVLGENKLVKLVALTNSFVIATTVSFISIFDNLIIQVLVGFIFLVIIILIVYHIIGKHYGGKNNE